MAGGGLTSDTVPSPPPGGLLGRLVRSFPALRHRNFRRYMFGQSISLVGFWMQSMAMGWLVYRLSGSEIALGAVAATAYLPVLLLSPVAGVIADRFPKRPLVLVTQGLLMLSAALLGVLTMTGTVTVPMVAALALLQGAVGAFDLPTRQSFIVELVGGARDLPSAIALNASVFNTARVVGPAIAGGLLGIVGEGPCFLANAASYVALIWGVAGMDVAPRALEAPATPVRASFRSGLTYVRGEPVQAALLLALGAVSALGLQANVIMPALAQRTFGAGAQAYGLLLTAFGVGAVLSALRLAAGRYTQAQHRRNLILGLSVFGAGLLGVAASPRLEVALACQLVAGLGMIRYTATTNALLQVLVADGYRGRVMGLHTVMFAGTAPVGSLVLGALAEHVGPPAALVLAGATAWTAALWLARRLR